MNAAQAGQTSTWRRSVVRRSEPPRSTASCSWISRQSASRALARAGQRLARLEHQRLDLVLAHAERRPDLLVAQGTELGQDERRALVLGQPLEVGEHVAQVLAALDLGREALDGGLGNVVERALLLAGAQDGEAAVAGDGVEPRLELDRLVAADEVAMGGDEGVLDGVLGLLAPSRACAGRTRGSRGGAGRTWPRRPARRRHAAAARALRLV